MTLRCDLAGQHGCVLFYSSREIRIEGIGMTGEEYQEFFKTMSVHDNASAILAHRMNQICGDAKMHTAQGRAELLHLLEKKKRHEEARAAAWKTVSATWQTKTPKVPEPWPTRTPK